MNDRKTVLVTKEQEAGMGEVYDMWYQCPSCEKEELCSHFEYCPMCGVGLKWEPRLRLLNVKDLGKLRGVRPGCEPIWVEETGETWTVVDNDQAAESEHVIKGMFANWIKQPTEHDP